MNIMSSHRIISYLFALSALNACSEEPPAQPVKVQPSSVPTTQPAHVVTSPSTPAAIRPDPRYRKEFSDEVEVQCAFDTAHTEAAHLHGTVSEAEHLAARDYFARRVAQGGLSDALNQFDTNQMATFIPECANLGLATAEQCLQEYVPNQLSSRSFSCVTLHKEFGPK